MNPNERIALGKTALEVTRLGLGTAPLAGLFAPVPQQQGHDTVARSIELGVNFFDTAPLYGAGESEKRVGHVLATQARDTYVLATKVGRLVLGDGSMAFDFSYDATMRSVDESLERLGVDRVDVLHIHDPDVEDLYAEALTGAYRALDDLRSQKVISAVGCGMNRSDWPTRFARDADFDCVLIAGRYTLLDQSAAHDLFPIALEKGIGIICGGVYNSGLLAGGTTYDYAPAPTRIAQRARAIGEVCMRHKIPLMAAAIQFPFAHPAVTTVITGAASVAELEETFGLAQIPIPAAMWDDLRTEGLLPADVPVPG